MKVMISTTFRRKRVRKKEINFPPYELVTTVDAVEKATGLDFFSKMPIEEQSALEAKSDFNEWER